MKNVKDALRKEAILTEKQIAMQTYSLRMKQRTTD